MILHVSPDQAPSTLTAFVKLARMALEGKMAASPQIGLCADCAHIRRIESDRGSVFFLCQLALTDDRFRKYPRLPVLECAGYQASAAQK